MKNPKARQPDPVSGTVEHEGVDKPMNDPMGTSTDSLINSESIDPDSLTNEMAEDGQDNAQEGLTPIHHQNIDESRVDEVLVDDSLDDKNYPDINDIADDDAVSQSFEDE